MVVDVTRKAIEKHHETHGGLVRVAACATIPGQCTDIYLDRCAEVVREFGVGFHCHLAETKPQAVYAQRRWGKSVVEKLDEVGLLGPGFTGAHAIWLTRRDIELLGSSGSSIAHNPGSNLKAGSGIAPIPELLAAGANVAVGTDGSINSDNQNMFEAMRLAAFVHRVRSPYQQDDWIGSAHVWNMATAGGASAMGLASEIGAIAPGYRADVVLLRRSAVHLTPFTNAANLLAYAETGASVDMVMVDGKTVVAGGRLVTLDEERILAELAAVAAEVNARNEHRRHAAERIWPHVNRICRRLMSEPFPLWDRDPFAAPDL
jgi:cytosine/adenosine deaminase-related metal-dependent hydrolase